MVKAVFHPNFKELFSKIKDKSLKERIIKQFIKIRQNPEVGKPIRFIREGTREKGIREVYVSPFRLSYTYFKNEDKIVFLDIYHKDEQ